MKKSFVSLSLLLLLGVAIPAIAQVSNGCIADYIIVGDGTAGATLAGLISDPIGTVLVLERGQNLATDPNVLSTNYAVVFPVGFNPKYSEMLTTIPGTVALPYVPGVSGLNYGITGLTQSGGKMWGGSSGHNYLLAFRGTPEVWNSWATTTGDSSWSYDSLLPIMQFIEHYTSDNPPIDTAQRGVAGPLFITQGEYNTGPSPVPVLTFALALSTATGAPIEPDYNDPSNHGDVCVSAFQYFVTPSGSTPQYNPTVSTRSFSVTAFEPPSVVNYTTGQGVGRPLNIVSFATVSRVLFNGTTAIGVEYILNGNPEHIFRAYARKKVILSAGAIHTPAILQRSGIGDPTLLGSLGIPVIVANSAVGANLQNQYGPFMAFVNTGTVGNMLPTGFSIVGLHDVVASSTARTIEDILAAGTNYAGNFFPQPQILIEAGVLATTNIIALSPQLIVNKSRGNVQIVDIDPTNEPLVNYNFYGDGPYTTAGTDANNAVAVLRLLGAIPGYSIPVTERLFPTAADYLDLTNARLFQAAQNVSLVQDHSAGTCGMGTSIGGGAVVDSDLNVLGANNLMVVDLSICPTLINGNPSFSAYVIAVKTAQNLGAVIS